MPWKIVPIDYTIKEPLHIKRWMCGNCGLIFDFQFDEFEPGWPKFDPPLYNYDFDESKRRELCPRCNVDFDELPLIPITIDKFNFGNFLKTTFVVEDNSHEKIILEIADCFQKDISVIKAGNSQNVKTFFRLAKSQGDLDFAYFLVDGDNNKPDKELLHETHFFHLEKYCIENYLLDFEVCASISNRTKGEIKQILLQTIQSKSRSLGKTPVSEFLIEKLTVSNIKPLLLSLIDASEFIKEFIHRLGFSDENKFQKKYIKYCHKTSKLEKIFPATMVNAIKNGKFKPVSKE